MREVQDTPPRLMFNIDSLPTLHKHGGPLAVLMVYFQSHKSILSQPLLCAQELGDDVTCGLEKGAALPDFTGFKFLFLIRFSTFDYQRGNPRVTPSGSGVPYIKLGATFHQDQNPDYPSVLAKLENMMHILPCQNTAFRHVI
jgi:hypothetical protein